MFVTLTAVAPPIRTTAGADVLRLPAKLTAIWVCALPAGAAVSHPAALPAATPRVRATAAGPPEGTPPRPAIGIVVVACAASVASSTRAERSGTNVPASPLTVQSKAVLAAAPSGADAV